MIHTSRTRYVFARFRMSGHTEDDPQVVPGHWVETDCAGRDAAIKEARDLAEARGVKIDPQRNGYDGVSAWSACTDASGNFGEPSWFTEWGSRDGTTPVAADFRYLPNGPCFHLRYVRSADHYQI